MHWVVGPFPTATRKESTMAWLLIRVIDAAAWFARIFLGVLQRS